MAGETLYQAFPRIQLQNGRAAFGGHQQWFARHTARASGCGPVAAANCLALFALQRPALPQGLGLSLLPNGRLEGSGFLAFMEEVYRRVGTKELGPLARMMDERHEAIRLLRASKQPHIQQEGKTLEEELLSRLPPSLGNSSTSFCRGVERCGRAMGLPASTNLLRTLHAGRGEALAFIRSGLEAGAPVVLLTWYNHHPIDHYPNGFSQAPVAGSVKLPHFITIVGLAEQDAGYGTCLIASDAGQRAKIGFDALWRSWQSPAAARSALIIVSPIRQG